MGVCHVQQSLLMQIVLLLILRPPPLQFTYEKVMFTPFNIMVSPLSVTREALPVISSASRPPLPHAVRSTMTINPCYHAKFTGASLLSRCPLRKSWPFKDYCERDDRVQRDGRIGFSWILVFFNIFFNIAWLPAVIIWLLLFSPSVHACAIEAMLSQWHRVWREPTRAKWPVRDLLVFS